MYGGILTKWTKVSAKTLAQLHRQTLFETPREDSRAQLGDSVTKCCSNARDLKLSPPIVAAFRRDGIVHSFTALLKHHNPSFIVHLFPKKTQRYSNAKFKNTAPEERAVKHKLILGIFVVEIIITFDPPMIGSLPRQELETTKWKVFCVVLLCVYIKKK